jgi:hypothetical protein
LVERFVYTEDVGGSSPSSPTILFFKICRKAALGLIADTITKRF